MLKLLPFVMQKKQAARKEKSDEEAWALSRFYPMVEVFIESTDRTIFFLILS